jgi:hypothetical protein
MQLRLEQVQIQALECSVCLQFFNRALGNDPAINKLFGAARYCLCPCCGQSVPWGRDDFEYRSRYRKFINQRKD